VRSSHERWDGTGYPDQLAGGDIPLGARIVAVCDAYEAMTADRPYRKALSAHAAREQLSANAGTQFDPAVVAAFLVALAPDQTAPARDANRAAVDMTAAHIRALLTRRTADADAICHRLRERPAVVPASE
jgi:HD-GYP domain-containing protein (c-di-GMP phosphodiesterase class II)